MIDEIKMSGERKINKDTRRLKIDEVMVDIMLPMMLENIENASKLNEEDFYLLDCLIKCKLVLVDIDVSEDYSTNVKNLLEYCKEESHKEKAYCYTYVLLTHNNINTMIQWILEKVKKDNRVTDSEEKTLKSLVNLKESFYNKVDDIKEWLKAIEDIEKEKLSLNLSEE